LIPVKICGITNLDNARYAVRSGAKAIGYIFYPGSPRFISPKSAGIISNGTDKKVKKVGVFVNESSSRIESIVRIAKLDFIQLHGTEPDGLSASLSKPVIRAIRIGKKETVRQILPDNVCAVLLDTWSKHAYGGTGQSFDWFELRQYKWDVPMILSGGLSPANINDAIQQASPQAIDINSGVEESPGVKDHRRIDRLFQKIKQTGPYKNIFLNSGQADTGLENPMKDMQ